MPDLLDTRFVKLASSNRITRTRGTAHGDNAHKWMDGVGALSALRSSAETCATIRMDQLTSSRP